MSTATTDFNQEPKKIFLAFLIDRLKVANYFIFIEGQDARGWDIMDGIIRSLNEAAQKALATQAEEIKRAIHSHKSCCSLRTREIYGEIATYLNSTYFEEGSFGSIVPTSALEGATPTPTGKIEFRKKAGL